MSVKCQVIMDAMDKLAPRNLAESWDNVGLLVGSPAQNISKILIALDVTQAVADEAAAIGADMIIAHHPLIFKGITNVRTDLPHGKLLSRLLKADIAVYAAHTNLDIAPGGVNDILANKLGLQEITPLAVTASETLLKLVVFVPETHVEQVRSAITAAGAGHVGNYSHCTFQTAGTGTFVPLAGTNPFIGTQGKLEYVAEFRLETILPEKISKRVIKAMLKAHPYEEVAYDLYRLNNEGTVFSLGRIGKLPSPVKLAEFATQVKTALSIKFISVCGPHDKLVNKVAVCGGSGASLINKAAFAGADVLVTGDVKYHEAQDALNAGLAVIDAGHFATEQPVTAYLAEVLRQYAVKDKWQVEVQEDTVSTDTFTIC